MSATRRPTCVADELDACGAQTEKARFGAGLTGRGTTIPKDGPCNVRRYVRLLATRRFRLGAGVGGPEGVLVVTTGTCSCFDASSRSTVFGAEPFTGNPLAVVLSAEGLST